MATVHQNCSICKSIPNRSRGFWKGGETLEDNLPAAMNQLKIVGAPLYDTDTGHSNYCLMQCPECGTYYAWNFEYEYLVNGSEDDLTLTRLDQAQGEERAQQVLRYVEEYKANVAAQSQHHVDVLLQAPLGSDSLWQAAHFFWDSQRKGIDITFAIPALVHAHARLDRMRSAAITIRMALSDFGALSPQNLQLVSDLEQAEGTR